ncbi:hypothetical protein AAFF_G00267990 [Aldrovandia affinis]|uniref:Inhibitory synaptic factor 1 n=1 Tax=Aldrovandia affinis TaxID=143900 RepID=A0AAD7SSE4_9TELE|nr:hypothetical protein AAFF_G00267990 [Aldrovandia affinis]
MSHSGAPVQQISETPSQRERIRGHMKMVITQLEGILTELKDVAKELREVVGQIDKLTEDFDFDLEPDDWTVATASSTSSSERGLGDAFRLDLFNPDVLSDSWEFCSFLEAPSLGSAPTPKPAPRPSDPEPAAEPVAAAKAATPYSQMNGGIPIPNGPLIVTPDSSSEEATSSTYSHKTSRTSGTRERVRFSDKILYHALCCDDDEDEGEAGGGRRRRRRRRRRAATPRRTASSAPLSPRPRPRPRPPNTRSTTAWAPPLPRRLCGLGEGRQWRHWALPRPRGKASSIQAAGKNFCLSNCTCS